MNVPNLSDPVWADVITGKKECQFQFLALNLFMSRVRICGSLSTAEISRYAEDLRKMIAENLAHPKIQNDLKQITR